MINEYQELSFPEVEHDQHVVIYPQLFSFSQVPL